MPLPTFSHPTEPRRAPLLAWASVLLGFGSLGSVPFAAAQNDPGETQVAEVTASGPLETAIVVETLVVERDRDTESRRWVPAVTLSAGDEVHYTIRVRNPGKQPVTDVVVTKRLPFGVRYQRGSAAGPACTILFSQDGGLTFSKPEAAPKSARKPPASEFTHVRWVLSRPLSPGATALLRFRAKFS